MRLTLKDVGYSHMKKIMKGREWVGRVVTCHGDKAGKFYGRIGKLEAYGTSFEDAFRKVGALFLGHKSVADLNVHNAKVATENRERRARLAPAKHALETGDFKTFVEELDKAFERDAARISEGKV